MKMPSNTPPAKDPNALWKHFSDTYFSLRLGLAILAFAFPAVLYFYGKYRHGLDLQPSMSAYFWAAGDGQCASFPMRTIFVGFLFAIGVGLYVYKGLTTLENYLLNGAGICAALVAIYPERLDYPATGDRIAALYKNCPAVEVWAQQPAVPVHWMAAVTLFLLLAIVAWACASKSLHYLPPEHDDAKFRRAYKAIAIGMVLFPLPGVLVAYLFDAMSHWIFFVEAAGIITFGVYWAFKSRELSLSQLEADPDEAVRHSRDRQSAAPAGDAPRDPGPAGAPSGVR